MVSMQMFYFTRKKHDFFMEVSFPVISFSRPVWLGHFSKLYCLAQPTASQSCPLLVPTLKTRRWKPGKGKAGRQDVCLAHFIHFLFYININIINTNININIDVNIDINISILLLYRIPQVPSREMPGSLSPLCPMHSRLGSRAAGCQRELIFKPSPRDGQAGGSSQAGHRELLSPVCRVTVATAEHTGRAGLEQAP